VNKEVEFGILDARAFRQFLNKMSAKLLYTKRKSGSSWRGGNDILAELVVVEGLGEYLEVEKLFEDGLDVNTGAVKKTLIEIIERCGLSKRDIEARPYSQLLGMPRY
jgi:predicted adenylyl cyclase CyaB